MAKVVKMCDMHPILAAKVFAMLNYNKVILKSGRITEYCVLVTDVEPKDLTYPEGWYYAKGNFRNKHMSSTGVYGEIRMVKSNGDSWEQIAKYCSLYC